MPSVLFVCTANRCRSPLAEAIFNGHLQRLGEQAGWRVASAGTSAYPGQPATTQVYQVLDELGLRLPDHRSQNAGGELLNEFQLILVMEERHRRLLAAKNPHRKDQIYLLPEMVGESAEVMDPYGADLETYRSVAKRIADSIDKGFERIRILAS